MSHRQFVLSDPSMIPTTNSDPLTSEAILPDLIIWFYIGAIVVVGLILNFIIFCAALKGKGNGTSIFVTQLVVIDIVSLGLATVELLYMNKRKWIFEPALCPVYLGLDSITTTASVYFVIAINLHAISTYNLATATKTSDDKRKPLMFRRSSNCHLNNESCTSALCTHQQRSLTIDYSKQPKNKISVLCPILFIWILAVSVSVPLFTFGTLLPNRKSALICGMENFNRGTDIVLQLLVLFIRIVIPSLCLIVTFVCVTTKYLRSKSNHQLQLSDRPKRFNGNTHTSLKLGVVLSILYIVFSTQRVYGSLMFEIMTKPFMQYKYPAFDKFVSILFCMINYTIPAVRPVIYLFVDKQLRTMIGQGCKNNNNDDVDDVR